MGIADYMLLIFYLADVSYFILVGRKRATFIGLIYYTHYILH